MDLKKATESLAFLETMFRGKSDDLWLYLWKEDRSKWFQSIEKAAQFGFEKSNYYFGCCLSPKDNGEYKRCTAANAAASPGFWCDIDYSDGTAAHKAKNLPFPPSEESAHKIIDAVGTKPTMIVHSGHGLQAYWLFESLLIFADAKQRKDFAQRSQAFQERLIAIGASFGWHVDSVGDLARILRLPGTINAKADCPEVPCRLLVADGPRIQSADEMIGSVLTPIQKNRLNFESNGHAKTAVAVFVDENPESGTRVGKPIEEWDRIGRGVGEGERNVAATKWAGIIISGMGDCFDSTRIRVGWLNFENWNLRNSPPLDTDELRTTWNSILRAEQSKASAKNASEAFKMLVAPGEDSEPESQPREWRLTVVDSRPPVYRVYGPKYIGFVECSVAEFMTWGKLRVKIGEQKGVGLQQTLSAGWEKAPKGEKALFERLMDEKTIEEATPEESPDSRLAASVAESLELATLVDEPTEACRTNWQKTSTGDTYFSFPILSRNISMKSTEKISETDLARLLKKCGVSCRSLRFGSLVVRVRIADPKAMAAIRSLAGFVTAVTGEGDFVAP